LANLLTRLIDPWYPATAIGLEKGVASVIQLERVKGSTCRLRRAATFNIADVSICIGAGLLILDVFLSKRKERMKSPAIQNPKSEIQNS